MQAYHRLSLLRKLEVGNQKSEVGSRKSEVGSRKTLLGFPKWEIIANNSYSPNTPLTSVLNPLSTEIRPILRSLDHLYSHDYFAGVLNWKELIMTLDRLECGSLISQGAEPVVKKRTKGKHLMRKSRLVMQHLIDLCWHHVLHLVQTLSSSD